LARSANIRAAIEANIAMRAEKIGITAEWVLRRLQQEAEYTGKGSSHAARVSALGLAMKHLGMLKQDAPHTDRNPFDLSGLSDAELDRILLVVGPVLGFDPPPAHVSGEVPAPAPAAVERILPP
jgi:hypothetical protein